MHIQKVGIIFLKMTSSQMPDFHRDHSKNVNYVQYHLHMNLFSFSSWNLSLSENQTSAGLL